MKDNNQSDNLNALIDAGIRSFKIEGRYKDMGYVKNITAHYRTLLDEIIDARPEFARASSGRSTFSFTPDPDQNFNRGSTDYFVTGRKDDIGAFDSPKNPGLSIGYISKVTPKWIEIETSATLHNGDGLCYYDLQKELQGLAANRVEVIDVQHWQVFPKDAINTFKDLRVGTEINRNRDMSWQRVLDKKSSDRRIGLWLTLADTADGLSLAITDEDGLTATAHAPLPEQTANDTARAEASLRDNLGKLGTSIFEPVEIVLALSQPWFVPASAINALRREAVKTLETVRAAAYQRPSRARPLDPPVTYPEDTLSYLANVYNARAHDFYARHGVKLIAAAYESHEEDGEVSLMITKHCVRFSLSLCPKQTRGITGVQGTIKAEPLTLVNGSEKLTLRFDCKPCEMHVVGKMKRSVVNQQVQTAKTMPMQFYKTKPAR